MNEYTFDNPARVFSFGGGVQSTAILVLQAQGHLTPYESFIFANVGADSENPATLDYIERITKPYAARHGINFVEVQKTRKGQPDTIASAIYRENRTIIIPARMSDTGAPGHRNCTVDYKIRVLDRYLKINGLSPVIVGLGISLDEWQRMKDTDWHNLESGKLLGIDKKREYPLIDRRLNRNQCLRIIESAGLPIPPKSSCFFCPYHKQGEWIDMKRDTPELFKRACDVETQINRKRTALNRDGLYLHSSLKPLPQAVADQPRLFTETETCESGYCFT